MWTKLRTLEMPFCSQCMENMLLSTAGNHARNSNKCDSQWGALNWFSVMIPMVGCCWNWNNCTANSVYLWIVFLSTMSFDKNLLLCLADKASLQDGLVKKVHRMLKMEVHLMSCMSWMKVFCDNDCHGQSWSLILILQLCTSSTSPGTMSVPWLYLMDTEATHQPKMKLTADDLVPTLLGPL